MTIQAGGPQHAVIFSGGRDFHWGLFRAARGLVASYTEPSWDKETPNEDAAGIIPFGEGAAVLAVADGLGGMRGGAQASLAVIQALKQALQEAYAEDRMLRTAILDGIEHANRAIMDLGIGAGTTLVVMEIQEDTVRPYHIGDSQILVVGQRGKVKLQTVAHSPTGFAVEAGLLDENDAIHHHDRHYVSNIIGTPDMRIEVGTAVQLAAKDTLLLGSDGLFDNLQIDEIIDTIRRGAIEKVMEHLARKAKERMANAQEGLPSHPDDLTFLMYRRDH